MLKALVLQKFHGLSDEQTEYQILDRFSFQRFLGLDAGDGAPDARTIWLFKEKLGREGLEALFGRFDSHMRERGLLGKQGKIVDASFVEAPRQRNSREDNAAIRRGERPRRFDSNARVGAQKDTDARWARKAGRNYFGYKNHAKVDAASKLVESYRVSAANVHDSQLLEELVGERDNALFADSAYSGAPLSKVLEGKGIGSFIHERSRRGRPLSGEQKRDNKIKSQVRARVEHVFGRMAQMKADWFRRVGIERARFEIGLSNLVYNFDRYALLCSRG